MIRVLLFICLGHLIFLFGCNEKPLNAPFIKSFSPSTSAIEGIITITGRNFGSTALDNIVNINGSHCWILSVFDTMLIVRADPGVSSGILSVTVNNLSAIATSQFKLIPHVIDTISSYSGSVGDKIDFSGSYFCANASDVEVKFDSKIAAILNYRLQHDTTYFSTLVPTGATTGKIHVRIGAVTVLSRKDFTVN